MSAVSNKYCSCDDLKGRSKKKLETADQIEPLGRPLISIHYAWWISARRFFKIVLKRAFSFYTLQFARNFIGLYYLLLTK